MKDKFETFRTGEKERAALKALAKRAKMSKSDYIRHYYGQGHKQTGTGC